MREGKKCEKLKKREKKGKREGKRREKEGEIKITVQKQERDLPMP